MSRAAQNLGGKLFDWLSPAASAPEAPQESTAPQEATAQILPHPHAGAPAPQAASAQDMLSLLDAERRASAGDDFAAAEATTTAAEHAGYTLDDFTPEDSLRSGAAHGIHRLPSEGWLVSALSYDVQTPEPVAEDAAASTLLEPVAEELHDEPAMEAAPVEPEQDAWKTEPAMEAEAPAAPGTPLMARLSQGLSALVRRMPSLDGMVVLSAAEQAATAATNEEAPIPAFAAQEPVASDEEAAVPHLSAPLELALPSASLGAMSAAAVDALLTFPEATAATWKQDALATPSSSLPEWFESRLNAHHAWVESNGSEGKRFRAMGEDFSAISFAGQNLAHASFRGAYLAGLDFRGANLEATDFTEADLSRATLAEAHAEEAIFARANLAYSDLQAIQAERANFNYADLSGARMKEAQLSGVQAREANFQGVVAVDVVLRQANLRSARFFESILPGADLRGADMRSALLERVVLSDAQLAGASLRDAELIGLDYAQADFTVALDVAQEVQLLALTVERGKLNEARQVLEARLSTLQDRERKLIAALRILEHKRHHDGQFDAQEKHLYESLAKHQAWLRNSGFWWAGAAVALLGTALWAISDVPLAAVNLPVLGTLAAYGVVILMLAGLTLARVWRVRRALTQLLRHREALKKSLETVG